MLQLQLHLCLNQRCMVGFVNEPWKLVVIDSFDFTGIHITENESHYPNKGELN